MKPKFLSIAIVIIGILLSITRHIGMTINLTKALVLGAVLLIVFVITIIKYNRVLNERDELVIDVNSNEKSRIQKLANSSGVDLSELDFDEKKKFFLITISIGLILALYLGFKYKRITDTYILGKAAKKTAEWQKEIYIESYTANDGFFKLEGYAFNFEIFFICLIVTIVIALFIWNTVYYDRLKNYVQNIRR